MDLQDGTSIPHSAERFRPEEDYTFAPPALSAYSIALLSDASDGKRVMGQTGLLHDIPLRPNPVLKDSLKTKLAVHFSELDVKLTSASSFLSNLDNPHTANSTLKHGSSNGSYSASMSNGSPISTNMSFGNISGHTAASNASNVSSLNITQSPIRDSNLHHAQFEQVHSSNSSAVLTDAAKSTMRPPRPVSTGAAKKSRLARFASLGPPKRASELISEHKTDHVEHDAMGISLAHPAESSFAGLKRQSSTDMTPPRKTITGDSEFFRSLNKLKQKFENNENISLAGRGEGKVNLGLLDTRPTSRSALEMVLPNSFNTKKNFEPFKKPKTSISPFPKPATLVNEPRISRLHTQNSLRTTGERRVVEDESSRRKIIRVNANQYEKLELLGRGGSSKVYKVKSLKTKGLFAIKKVSFDQFDESCVRGFKGEIDLLNKLRNEPRVVSLFEHATSEGSLYLVMECGEIDLAHVLQSKLATGAPMDINFIRFHATEILRCVEAVHNAGVVHSDLKPANFLFVRGVLKIIDFGIANAVPEHTANIYRHSQIGTPNYMAPEALVEVNHTVSFSGKESGTTWRVGRPSDIWSCGCIIYQMIYGRPPYGNYSGQQRIMAIMNPQVKIQYPDRGFGEAKVAQSLVDLIKKCLERNPSQRWTVEQCLASDFLKPKAVSRAFLRDLVYSAVTYGYNNKDYGEVTDDIYDKLVDTVLHQIEDLNFA